MTEYEQEFSTFYALNWWGWQHISIYMQYINEGTIKEGKVFCKLLETRTTSEEI